eukprot:GHUV01022235.1.p1 GENE.GHUV01022235.1~~GHUV01022235.1.p1  ORF type:complete len:112 (-),score=24.70 GHUV01022235.1:328-663(-)
MLQLAGYRPSGSLNGALNPIPLLLSNVSLVSLGARFAGPFASLWQSTRAATMGKVHGSLARAGKVRGQAPKVPKQEKKKKPTGRAMKRIKYNRRFVNVVVGFGKKKGPNSQ